MKRIETSIDKVKAEIQNFYKAGDQHFMVINAVDLGDTIEVQWFFSDYAAPFEITAFCAKIQPGIEIPSIKDIVPSSWIAEAELVDLMDIKIENTQKGFVLEPDFEGGPLRKKK
jgi:Respiratory-chain NADH dehydrogenase, 30 Kd subunit